MASLNNICYKQIKGNYYYGIFGEFQLVVDKTTGCFNATKLCNIGGKKFKEWTRLNRSNRLVEYSESCGGKSLRGFYEIKGDNNDFLNKQITGQYVQKELILDIASWISPEFYFKCNNIIINYFANEFQNMDEQEKQTEIDQLEQRMKQLLIENENKDSVIQEKVDRIDELIEITKRMENQNKKQEKMLKTLGIQVDDVYQQNNELLEKVDDIQQKLDIAVEDRAPQPNPSYKCERFILLRRDDPDYPYYTIRAQNVSCKTALRTQQTNFGEITILLDLPYHPNSKTLFVRVKEELKKQGVVFNMCKLSIANSEVTEKELIEVMRKIDSEKRDV
ncbi:MAG: DUF3627 domain-containing protein [Cetobacterium sp.]